MLRLLTILLFLVACNVQSQTIGLIQHNNSSIDSGYVLFSPISSNNTYLIDACGILRHSWTSNYKPGQSVYLLDDGSILRTGNANNQTFTAGGKGGVIEKRDWNNNLLWTYTLSNSNECQHHDVKPLPNGNVLIIAWELKTSADAIAAGRNPSLVNTSVWSEKVIEVQPSGTTGGNIVWEWHLWDHLVQDYDSSKLNYGVVANHPELINLNYAAVANNSDWIHLNSIDYNPSLDQILLSSHSFSEIWVIDHSTNTAEAASHQGGNASHGGDILYRWGNQAAYNSGTTVNKKFFGQHHAHWIENGLPYANQIMVFNNGLGRTGGNYSTVEIINPPVTGNSYNPSLPYLPAQPSWIYNSGNTNSFYAQNISSAQQLPSGNVLICNGPAGTFAEIDSSGNPVWKYINPVSSTGILSQNSTPSSNQVFRCSYYPSSFSGFSNQVFAGSSTIENNNILSNSCNTSVQIIEQENKTWNVRYINQELVLSNLAIGTSIELLDALGKKLIQGVASTNEQVITTSNLASGMYILIVKDRQGNISCKKICF